MNLCGSILLLLFLSSMVAPVLGMPSFSNIDLDHRLQPPSSSHVFGTDELGRDILSRLLYGGRISFQVSLLVVLFSLGIGLCIGCVAGISGGWMDELLMRAVDILLAFPGILLAIGLMAVLGPNIQNVIVALVIVGWVGYARLARGLTLQLREMNFVQASRSLGASPGRILLRHILPNMLPSMIVQASFGFAGVILAESALSFLGLGVQAPQPSWGNMLSDGKNHLLDAPHLTIFPGLAIFITVLCFNLLGDALRDRLDPRLAAKQPGL
jgi:peptide/nickel transport system permease protein